MQPATVRLTHDYPYSSDLVWKVATDLDHLKAVTKGLLTFRDLPSGKIFQGQTLNVQVSLFGLLPYQPYEMMVERLDAECQTFQSSEMGAGVKSWKHFLAIRNLENGCRLEEEVVIDAGWATPLFAVWAKFMYGKRHQPRLRILEELSAKN